MTNKRVSRREFLKIGGTGLAGDVSPEQAVKTLQSELEQIVEQGA